MSTADKGSDDDSLVKIENVKDEKDVEMDEDSGKAKSVHQEEIVDENVQENQIKDTEIQEKVDNEENSFVLEQNLSAEQREEVQGDNSDCEKSSVDKDEPVTLTEKDSVIQIDESSSEFMGKATSTKDVAKITDVDDYSLDVPDEECKIEAEDITIKEFFDDDIDLKSSSENHSNQATSSDSQKQTKEVSNVVSKDISTLRMQMSKEDIERMISEGKLEKVSEGFYKFKACSLQDLKISGRSATLQKSAQGGKLDENETPILKSVLSEKSVITAKRTGSKIGPVTKKLKTVNEPVKVTKIDPPSQVTKIVTTPVTLQTPLTTVVPPATIQSSPSYIALMPVNQVSNNTNNAIITLPVQPNIVTNYNPTLPTLITIPQGSIPSTLATPTQIITEVKKTPQPSTPIPNPSSSLPLKTMQQPKTIKAPVLTEKTVKPSITILESSIPTTVSQQSSAQKPKITEGSTSPIVSTPVSSSNITGPKRKSQSETNKVRRPYKFAKPLRKRRRSRKLKDFVSDMNTSEEEEEDDNLEKCKSQGSELAAMFFKKIGEPTKPNKSLLDRLHKAIFTDANLNSEEEEDSEESDADDVVSNIKTGKSRYQTVNCPGPGQYEAYVGPANNSKLSIIRCKETKQIKNFLYEVYKVRVASAGREANTNILIPVPDGYKFQLPSKSKEELVEFSHVPHEDPESTNNVSPIFLEKLADAELKLRKYKEEIKVLRHRYCELLQEYANRPQFSTLSDLVGASAKFLTEDQLVFFLMQLKAGAQNMQGIRYSVREKVLALSIYQKSPEVYKWLRKVFHLPSKRILDQWLEDVGAQDPQLLKKLMYHIYTTYNFKPET